MGMLKTAVIISLPILGVCATVLYLLHKKEDEDLQDTLQDVRTSRVKVIEMKIPKSVVGVVIGRGGSNVKDIQEKTDTRIYFKDMEDDEFRVCYIRGVAEAAQQAESMIHEIIKSQPLIELKEIWVPQRSVGRIIGRNGESIRSIKMASNAKINVESLSSGATRGGDGETRICIKGTMEQIAVAVSLINEKVEEDYEMRRKMELSHASRSPRNKPKSNTSPSITVAKDNKSGISQWLSATGSDGILQVFVSAVVSPSCFWIQVFSPSSAELDQLVQEMTDYYTVEENRSFHALNKVDVGQIVATPFSHDNKWYRAEVKAIVKGDCDDEDQVDLYYVDYGDKEFHLKSEILQLRTDFLKLRFQAIECSLANVKPSDGEEWSEKAVDLFEELAHVAQWKLLNAKVVSCDNVPRGRREGSPVPSVNLYDTSGSEDINITEELVKQGFAVREELSRNGSVRSRSGASTPFLQSPEPPEIVSDTESMT
ncbi:tudor and KH domain-containing protein homolog [Macrosteles quadrilineatus]|uniref:tudor and KH domain-containing protein homolog n=1 Tax=Macrosteles quadrilineatus TaxID=74068 RepID=UPI0023E25100|nr:tudor and KH domain-containing protein homolog [Macrosteles quadrilineatus]XP_054268566.1 tudor and KH domain-containing protein homolog [Macrosteles quadrilineatus]